MNLKQLSTRPLGPVRTSAVIFLLVVAIIGFADASYLTVEHFRGVIPPCSVVSGCEKVLTSQYSVVLGVPVSLLGALYYLVIALGSFLYLESKHSNALQARHSEILKWTLIATVLGFIMSLWFIFLQVFIIHSYCMYCMGSAGTSIILFVTAMAILSKNMSVATDLEASSQSL